MFSQFRRFQFLAILLELSCMKPTLCQEAFGDAWPGTELPASHGGLDTLVAGPALSRVLKRLLLQKLQVHRQYM